jgi:hypothetical protein
MRLYIVVLVDSWIHSPAPFCSTCICQNNTDHRDGVHDTRPAALQNSQKRSCGGQGDGTHSPLAVRHHTTLDIPLSETKVTLMTDTSRVGTTQAREEQTREIVAFSCAVCACIRRLSVDVWLAARSTLSLSFSLSTSSDFSDVAVLPAGLAGSIILALTVLIDRVQYTHVRTSRYGYAKDTYVQSTTRDLKTSNGVASTRGQAIHDSKLDAARCFCDERFSWR